MAECFVAAGAQVTIVGRRPEPLRAACAALGANAAWLAADITDPACVAAMRVTAAAMRASLAVTGIAPAHCHTLLAAFRQDAVKNRYADWQQLMDYCALSAAPVGRYLLDLHGESPATWHSSDALCAALQVIIVLDCIGHEILRRNARLRRFNPIRVCPGMVRMIK